MYFGDFAGYFTSDGQHDFEIAVQILSFRNFEIFLAQSPSVLAVLNLNDGISFFVFADNSFQSHSGFEFGNVKRVPEFEDGFSQRDVNFPVFSDFDDSGSDQFVSVEVGLGIRQMSIREFVELSPDRQIVGDSDVAPVTVAFVDVPDDDHSDLQTPGSQLEDSASQISVLLLFPEHFLEVQSGSRLRGKSFFPVFTIQNAFSERNFEVSAGVLRQDSEGYQVVFGEFREGVRQPFVGNFEGVDLSEHVIVDLDSQLLIVAAFVVVFVGVVATHLSDSHDSDVEGDDVFDERNFDVSQRGVVVVVVAVFGEFLDGDLDSLSGTEMLLQMLQFVNFLGDESLLEVGDSGEAGHVGLVFVVEFDVQGVDTVGVH